MRKTRVLAGLVVVLLVGVVSSCSLSIFGGGGISPPSWIRGTWSNGTGYYRFEFSSHNIKQLMDDSVMIDFSSPSYTVSEKTKTSSIYSVDLEGPSGTVNYKFEKETNTTLSFTMTVNSQSLGTITLEKE